MAIAIDGRIVGRKGTLRRTQPTQPPHSRVAPERGQQRAWLLRQLARDVAMPPAAFVDYFAHRDASR
jgi:hypothetical protein